MNNPNENKKKLFEINKEEKINKKLIGKKHLRPEDNNENMNSNNIKEKNNEESNYSNQFIKSNNSPDNMTFLTKLCDSYVGLNYDNSFIILKALENCYFLIYISNKKSINCYNLLYMEITAKINLSDDFYSISCLKHFYDKKNNRDLILVISHFNHLLKIWNLSNWDCICTIPKFNKIGISFSALMMEINGEINIVTSNAYSEPIKFFDLNGNKIKEINNSTFDNTIFIENYYDKNKNTNYIICINKYELKNSRNYAKSYNIENNELYHEYYNNKNYSINDITIFESGNITKLMGSYNDKTIRIWDFHSGTELSTIYLYHDITSICLWDDNNIFIGTYDGELLLYNLENKIIKKIQNKNHHNNPISTIKKFRHPIFGEFLLTQGYKKDKINIWIRNNS